MIGKLVSVNVGVPRTVRWKGKLRSTSIWKDPVGGRVHASGINLAGDEQADRKVHGGPRKAVYAYGLEDYRWWEQTLANPLAPGTFGENLTVEGVDFETVVPSERWSIGGAVFRVTQPRVPCWKLGARMDDHGFPRRFLFAARTGAYLSILEPGDVGAGDEIRLLHRPEIPLTIGLLARLNAHDPELSGLLMQLAEQELPPPQWPPLIEAANAAIEGATISGLPDESAL